MIDEPDLRDPESTGSACPTPGEAWEEVLELMGSLGDAVVRWSAAAAKEPDTQQTLNQVHAGLSDIGLKAFAALGSVARGDFVRPVEEEAEQADKVIRDTAQQASEAVAPYLGIVLAGLSDIFGKVAERVDGTTSAHLGTPVDVAAFAAPTPTVSPSEGNATTPQDE